MHNKSICICMRTTLVLKDELVERAQELTHIQEKTALIHAGLEALITKHARERLAALGGSNPFAKVIPRRRTKK